MTRVELSNDELSLAESWARRLTGTLRHHDYGLATVRHRKPAVEERIRFIALCAELAVARFLSLPWRRPSEKVIPDVGDDVGVRWSKLGSLIVRERDPEDFRYFLVTEEPPEMDLRGYLRGYEAREDGWWRDDWHPPAWVVPARDLHPVAHTCGWAKLPDGTFRCINDYYDQREPSCGATWPT